MRTRMIPAAVVLAALLATPALSAADPVLEWNSIMMQTTATQNPFFQARFAAITQLAVFEAVNSITHDYDPYLGTIAAPQTASAEAAAVAAAHGVLKNYFPASAASLDAARANSLAAIPDGAAKQQGIATGEAAAAAMIALRASDGSTPPEFYLPTSAAVGEWQPTPGCPAAGGILKQWRNLQPFGVETTHQFRPEAPPALTSLRYTRDYDEVRRVGGVASQSRPQDRADVARFYVAAYRSPDMERRSRASRRGAGALLVRERACVRAAQRGDQRRSRLGPWRRSTSITSGVRRPRFAPVMRTATRGLRVRPASRPSWSHPASRATRPRMRAAAGAAREVLERLYGPRHHFIQLTTPTLPTVVLAVQQLQADRRRHRRCARVRRDPLPLRSGDGRRAGPARGRLCVQAHAAALNGGIACKPRATMQGFFCCFSVCFQQHGHRSKTRLHHPTQGISPRLSR